MPNGGLCDRQRSKCGSDNGILRLGESMQFLPRRTRSHFSCPVRPSKRVSSNSDGTTIPNLTVLTTAQLRCRRRPPACASRRRGGRERVALCGEQRCMPLRLPAPPTASVERQASASRPCPSGACDQPGLDTYRARTAASILREVIVDRERNAVASNFPHQVRRQRWTSIKARLEVTTPPNRAVLKSKRGYFCLSRAQTP